MLAYITVLTVYLLSYPAAYWITGSRSYALLAKLFLVSISLYFFREDFRFRMRWDLISFAAGIVIFLQWIGLTNPFAVVGTLNGTPYSAYEVVLKLLVGVVIAPVVEEFFTRFFLMRYIISPAWRKVKLGAYTPLSFVMTVLFFGLSHGRWLAGIISAVMLNLLIYYRKNIESCIFAHAVANLALGAYVIVTGSWEFW